MKHYQSLGFGNRYSPEGTSFKLYAKDCDAVEVYIYADGNAYKHTAFSMHLMGNFIWQVTVSGDLKGQFYCYRVKRGIESYVAPDPFALASSDNSRRSAIVDLNAVSIPGFDEDQFVNIHYKDAVIYETHVRDMTMDAELSLQYPGKYLGIIEESNSDLPYGLSYLKDLGITHLHFLPLQDFLSVDELKQQYNWGYDPEHYFVPEGSYSTQPQHPAKRMQEVQQMVKACHDMGIAVIVDVVYNHTYRSVDHPFALLAPLTYYRHHKDGSYSNGSGCGNELDTEQPIVRQLILDSLLHWMDFYHIDGFRFDLMGLMDTETAQMIVEQVRLRNPNALIYGEPWTGGGTTLPWEKQVLKGKQGGQHYALFNDDFRNALKGDNDGKDHGFVQGYKAKMHDIQTGIVGSIQYTDKISGFCKEPWETINYMSAHDNLCLYDKLKYSTMWDDAKIKEATKMGLSLILLSFGIPFLQAGSEMMRTKHMDHNSYRSNDAVNAIRWRNVLEHADLVSHVSHVISLRKYLKCFGTYDAAKIKKSLHFLKEPSLLGYQIELENSDFSCVLILINPLHQAAHAHVKLTPDSMILFDGYTFIEEGVKASPDQLQKLILEPFQVMVIGRHGKRIVVSES